MQALSQLGLARLQQAVGFHAASLREQNSPVTATVENDLSTLSNYLRDARKELEERGRITVEIKKGNQRKIYE